MLVRYSHLVAVVVVGLFAALGRAQASINLSARCEALRSVDLSFQIQDAPLQITEAKMADATSNRPAHCQVSGYVAPNVGFLLRLPIDHWNGKLAQVACGAFCGSTDDQIYAFNCNNPLRRGYACIVSDNGHQSTPFDALWAYSNLQANVDYAYRGPHVTALAGKAIATHYYGQLPRKSYFLGCSNGGRQGLILAQRFPRDFDGIVAGAPELSMSDHFMSQLWSARALTNADGEAIVTKADLEVLHQAVVAKCDRNDGIVDGLIGDPRLCSFDASELTCTLDRKAACLSPSQVEAVRKVYSGPATSTGERIYMPSALPGSELLWSLYISPGIGPNSMLLEYFRYIAFQPAAGPAWKAADFDFDRDVARLAVTSALYFATSPDLRAFKAAGGKLLSYTGWADPIVSPLAAVDYYETVERTSGGRALTQDYFRLFVMPGLDHCYGGEGASVVDYLSYLEAWVEQGQAPDKIISVRVKTDDLFPKLSPPKPGAYQQLKLRREFPLNSVFIEFSRPVYPYPTRVKYLGEGDPKNAASFGPAEP